MAENQSTAGNPGNPPVDIEPHQIDIAPDHTVGGIEIVILDRLGRGFRTVLDQAVAIDVVLRMTGALARLRGYTTP